jgi:hypothetical protein
MVGMGMFGCRFVLEGASWGVSFLDLCLGFSQSRLHYHVHDAIEGLVQFLGFVVEVVFIVGLPCFVLFL